MRRLNSILLLSALSLSPALAADPAPKFLSHPPIRPLPTANARPLADGPKLFVDATKGLDTGDGSESKPWKSLQHAVKKLKAGDTLYLRGGTYYEHVDVKVSGTSDKPITIRSYPKELAIIDGGLREFFETPEKAWEPCPDGAEGEFRSVKTYTDVGSAGEGTNLLGNFGDSMIPLQGYKFLGDLRSSNIYWDVTVKTGPQSNIYCGPGIHHDLTTGRIHVRLAHTKMPYLPAEDNYQGITDPRKIPLILAGHQGGSPLSLQEVRHVRLQDLVVRGSRGPTVEVIGSEGIEFDGLTVYGGSTCFVVKETVGLRVLNTACRGIAAPWTFRGSLKYRAIESRLFSTGGWQPSGQESRDFEFAYSEFTDSVDGVFIGNVKRVRFHHNLLDNVTDDGIFLTAATAYDGVTPGGDIHIYQNRISRCLTSFAFGVGHGRQKVIADGVQTGAGVYIYRNVFDFRRPVWYHQPKSEKEAQEVTSKGRFGGDHGSPAWEPMFIYHNTIIADDVPRYTYGINGFGGAMGKGTKRRIFNNIVLQLDLLPGNVLPPSTTELQTDGNLFWSDKQGKSVQGAGEHFAKFRASKAFTESKDKYPPGWGANDLFADPKFLKFDANWKVNLDLGLQAGSPAIDAGVPIPQEWLDPVRDQDKGKPDIGALPLDAKAWNIGARGRLTMMGEATTQESLPQLPALKFTPRPSVQKIVKSAAIVEGYPAFDVPLIHYTLRRHGVPVESSVRAWLEPKKYENYSLVALNGNLLRAKVTHDKFTPDELKELDAYLKKGGVFVLTLTGRELFQTAEGLKFLAEVTGILPPVRGPGKTVTPAVLAPEHRWVKHLDPKIAETWLPTLSKQPGAPLAKLKG
ncbi:MAG: hypothetical protein K8T89_26350, partial [Planctomycetes bacterium]|nr:hypothetical protein [Planctomycetota bacterium]